MLEYIRVKIYGAADKSGVYQLKWEGKQCLLLIGWLKLTMAEA